jgi:nucleoid DNA-binding protein
MTITCKIFEGSKCKHICDDEMLLETDLEEAIHWQTVLGPHGGHILINPETGQKHYGLQTMQAHRDIAQLNKLEPGFMLPTNKGFKRYDPYGKPSQKTKRELSNHVASITGLPQAKVKEVVQLSLNTIMETILTDGRAELRGFGVFQIKQRPARVRQNPKTGERVDVPEKLRIVFIPGKEARHKLASMMR